MEALSGIHTRTSTKQKRNQASQLLSFLLHNNSAFKAQVLEVLANSDPKHMKSSTQWAKTSTYLSNEWNSSHQTCPIFTKSWFIILKVAISDSDPIAEYHLKIVEKNWAETIIRKNQCDFEVCMNTIFKVIITLTRRSLLPGYKQFTSRIQQSHQLQTTILKFVL